VWFFSLFATPRLGDAEAELAAELGSFAHDGLTQLAEDLADGTVQRATWQGCVLSYRRGGPGSVEHDRNGRRGNAFTRFWDSERFPGERALEMVRGEITARNPGRRRPADAGVGQGAAAPPG
jgi:hypothetical protein